MDYEISLSEDASFVIIHVKNSISPQTALLFTKESVELASKHNVNSYLIDVCGIENKWGVFETYQFAQEIQNYGLQRLDKVAILTESIDKTHSFLETTILNQGYTTKLFTSYDEAVVWLKTSNNFIS
jgi:hypothetical protein